MELSTLKQRVSEAGSLSVKYRAIRAEAESLQTEVTALTQTLADLQAKQDAFVRASGLLGLVSDEMTQKALNDVTAIVNKALLVLYPEGNRQIKITKTVYRKKYQHYNVDLIVDGGKVRSFKQSGSGLKQVIAFLLLLSFVDARGGRKLIVMDEILPGLHSSGKAIIKALMQAVSDRFQFVVIAYDFDIGDEFEVVRHGDTATITPYVGNRYYADHADVLSA